MTLASTPEVKIDAQRLIGRLQQLGEIGADPNGGRTRLAFTTQEKQGRDLVASWMREAGAQVRVDHIGNIHGVAAASAAHAAPVMIGSHIDTVVRAGAYDGCYGVVAGIEVVHAVARCGAPVLRPIVVTAFSNEEGVRFAPDLLGSRVVAKEIALEDALAIRSSDGSSVGDELSRIGYAGDISPWEILPSAFLELHIEQGPVLDAAGIPIGIVEAVQGHSWWRVAVAGTANHAGTTPMHARRDAGYVAMTLATELVRRASEGQVPNVATIGTMALEPNAINVVPGHASFSVDFRDHREDTLREAESLLENAVRELRDRGFRATSERISRHSPVRFDASVCAMLETVAAELSLPARRMLSGASHDAQMMARLCPTAMIFVPSHRGISHNPHEHTTPEALAQGADLLLHATLRLANATGDSRGNSGI